MKVHVSKLPTVINEYFETVLIPAASVRGSLWTFGAGFVGGLVSRQSATMIEQYMPILQQLAVVDSNGMVDIDVLYDEGSKAIARSRPTIAGYTADQSDLDKLKAIMIRHATPDPTISPPPPIATTAANNYSH